VPLGLAESAPEQVVIRTSLLFRTHSDLRQLFLTKGSVAPFKILALEYWKAIGIYCAFGQVTSLLCEVLFLGKVGRVA
jgi:hypothetical protein